MCPFSGSPLITGIAEPDEGDRSVDVRKVKRTGWPLHIRTGILLMSTPLLGLWSCATLQVVTTEHLNGQQLVPNAAPVAHIYARCGHPRSPCGNLHLGR